MFRVFFETPGEVPLGTGTPAPAAVPPAPAPGTPGEPLSRGVTCEFCDCRLDTRGQVLVRGDEAKRYMKLETDYEIMSRENAELKRKVQELTPAEPQKRTSMFAS